MYWYGCSLSFVQSTNCKNILMELPAFAFNFHLLQQISWFCASGVTYYARSNKKSYSYLCKRPWGPTGLWDVEVPTFSRKSAHGGEVVSLKDRPPPPAGRFLVLIFIRGWMDPRAVVRLEGLGQLKKLNDLIGNRTRELPACSINYATACPYYVRWSDVYLLDHYWHLMIRRSLYRKKTLFVWRAYMLVYDSISSPKDLKKMS
jgi:hypothetical protein